MKVRFIALIVSLACMACAQLELKGAKIDAGDGDGADKEQCQCGDGSNHGGGIIR